MSEMMDSMYNEEMVRQFLSTVPPETRRRGGGLIDKLVGFESNPKSTDPSGPAAREAAVDQQAQARDVVLDGAVRAPPDASELEHAMYGTDGIMKASTVEHGPMVALVASLNKIPHNVGPFIIRAVLLCALPLLMLGFADLPDEVKSAFVCCIAPGAGGLLTMRDYVQAFETVSLKEELNLVTHACALHDEGTSSAFAPRRRAVDYCRLTRSRPAPLSAPRPVCSS